MAAMEGHVVRTSRSVATRKKAKKRAFVIKITVFVRKLPHILIISPSDISRPHYILTLNEFQPTNKK